MANKQEKYKMVDTPNNRMQHQLFLKQYAEMDALEHKTEGQLIFLAVRKPQLTVEWISKDGKPIKKEMTEAKKSTTEVKKAIKKVTNKKK